MLLKYCCISNYRLLARSSFQIYVFSGKIPQKLLISALFQIALCTISICADHEHDGVSDSDTFIKIDI